MKTNKTLLMLFFLLTGCASIPETLTDTVTLYPDNAKAQQWGVVVFYRQYQRNEKNNTITLSLPDGKQLQGQITYINSSGRSRAAKHFAGSLSLGVGRGSGSYGTWGVNLVPSIIHYRSDIEKVSINAFGEGLGLNCQGDFNRRQQQGLLQCQLTNGMRYRGNLKRIVVKP